MKLSVVIVNYNVRYFLEQALYAVRKACLGIESEILVVDNHSADGSCEMVRRAFPEVRLIENKENVGFSKANNQAIRESKGEYVLLLNPDTVVEEDCFRKVLQFMDKTPDAGAAGVKMIDGKGHFLPESKRGLPTPEVAFYKMFGLSSLFPKSKRFGRYHLGYLNNDEINNVDVLAGAFMMLRKSVLDKIGLLDEDYFMYGEDIDLSYRITLNGFKNYYFPHTTIIHYKGESTKKSSINYVFVFYRAMVTFARKHYSQKHAATFGFLINLAIYIRAALSLLMRFAKNMLKPLADALLIYAGMYVIQLYWAQQVRFGEGIQYPLAFMKVNGIVYTLLWLAGLYLSGAYDKTRSFSTVLHGVFYGTIAIAVFYAFVPEGYRFSRALILFGAAWAAIAAYLNRLWWYAIQYKKFSLTMETATKTIIVGSSEEAARVYDLLMKVKASCDYAGYVSISKPQISDTYYLGTTENLADVVDLFKVEEIIFCSRDISAHQIINWMGQIRRPDIQFKIVPEESLFIIGSNSKNTQGDFYTLEISLALNNSLQLRKKRILDVLLSLCFLPLLPVLLTVVKKRLNFLSNIFSVLIGDKTWVGYISHSANTTLPKLKKNVLTPMDAYPNREVNEAALNKINFMYARDYNTGKDLSIILNGIANLGN
jgi:GT2 family glycosyltransferase